MITKILLCLILTVSLQVYGSNENNNSILVKRSHVTDSHQKFIDDIEHERKKQKKENKNDTDEFLYESIINHASPACKKVLTNYFLAREIVSYLDLENDMYQALGGKSFYEKNCNYQKVKNTISQAILCQKLLRKNKPDYTLQLANIPALKDYPQPILTHQESDLIIKRLSQTHSDRFIWFDPIFEYNDIKTAEIMLRCGADTSVTNWNGHPMLIIACIQGNEAMAKIAIDYDADVNQQSNHMYFSRHLNPKFITSLHTAIYHGKSLPIIRMLLEKGANINARDYFGTPPLLAALVKNKFQKDLVTLLLQYNPDLTLTEYGGETCLHRAGHCLDYLKILLNHGAQSILNVQDDHGLTPLHKAVQYGKTDNVKLFLEYGADTTIQDNDGKTPLDYTNTLFDEKNKKIIENLLKTNTK